MARIGGEGRGKERVEMGGSGKGRKGRRKEGRKGQGSDRPGSCFYPADMKCWIKHW